jgi:hypothetical protein
MVLPVIGQNYQSQRTQQAWDKYMVISSNLIKALKKVIYKINRYIIYLIDLEKKTMSRILVLAKSGFGKTFSMGKVEALGHVGLDPKETYVISVTSKPLTFP